MESDEISQEQAETFAKRWNYVLGLAGGFAVLGFLLSLGFVFRTVFDALRTDVYADATTALVGAGLFSIAILGLANEQRARWTKRAQQSAAASESH